MVITYRSTALSKLCKRGTLVVPARASSDCQSDVGLSTGVNPVPSFPWVHRHKSYGVLQGLYDRFRTRHPVNFLCCAIDAMGHKNAAQIVKDELCRCGGEALKDATKAIFHGGLIEGANQSHKPTLTTDILDEKLKAFFVNALHVQKSTTDVISPYLLQNIYRVNVMDMDLIVNGKRGAPLPPHANVVGWNPYGLHIFYTKEVPIITLREHTAQLMCSYEVCTVQAKVNVECTGINAVRSDTVCVTSDTEYLISNFSCRNIRCSKPEWIRRAGVTLPQESDTPGKNLLII